MRSTNEYEDRVRRSTNEYEDRVRRSTSGYWVTIIGYRNLPGQPTAPAAIRR